MNNVIYLLVTVQGSAIDTKKFSEYNDYDIFTPVPSAAASVVKAEAYTRYKILSVRLTNIGVPIYFEIQSTTGGDASTVPTSTEFVIGYSDADVLFERLYSLYGSGAVTDKQAFILTNLVTYIEDVLNPTSAYQDYKMEIIRTPARAPGAPGGGGSAGQLGMTNRDVPSISATVTVSDQVTISPLD